MIRKENRTKKWTRDKFFKLYLGILTAVIVCIRGCGSVAYAVEREAEDTVQKVDANVTDENSIWSHGSVALEKEAGALLYDSRDIHNIFYSLTEQKEMVMQRLLQLGTKFIQTGTGWQFLRQPDLAAGVLPKGTEVDWNLLLRAIKESQLVPIDIEVKEPKITLQIEGIAEVTDFYQTAVSDNISKGKAAWQNGTLLLGTGADNDRAYKQGKDDGKDNICPIDTFPIYHAEAAETVLTHCHIGSSADTEGYSGCYHNYATTERTATTCGAALYKTEVTWYPNEGEEGGGSWHGGYYTCPWHNGIYESAGTCGHETVQEKTVWHHDIICGKENLTYASLLLTGTEKETADNQIQLQAELKPQEGFSQLQFAAEPYFIWKNEAGEEISRGTSIEADAKGSYSCTVAVTNAEVTNLTGNLLVRVKGWQKSLNEQHS